MKRKIISVTTAFAMVFALMPIAPLGAMAGEDAPARAPIEELLAAGDYVEGEAIALVRSDGALDAETNTETLAEVDAEAVELAAEGAEKTESAADDEAALRIQSARSDAYTVQYVVDPERTTEQILRDLYADPDVIAAEPNYTFNAAATFANGPQATGKGAAAQQADTTIAMGDSDYLTAAAGVSNPGDLTEQQWDLSASTGSYTTPRAPTANYNINVPGWREGRTSESAAPNASGTVCIMDTGIDVNHPDLKNVVFEFTKAQQEKYGCGPHGKNASGIGEPGDVADYGDHGTHVAGIVAAQWNNVGVSGVANGVKVFSVRTFSERGAVSQKATIEGFKFLVDAAQEINLKAVNCSWGNVRAEFILTVMANELGKKGVNTVFASGNRAFDIDEHIDTGGQINSIYAITVNAAQPDGAMTDFSCWGQMSTDVFAPGAEILSTVPTSITMPGFHKDNTRFYPEGTAQENLLYGIDRFDADSSGVKFFDKNPALDASAKEIGSRTTQVGFDDKSAMQFNVRSLAKSNSFLSGYQKPENGSVFLAIPVQSVADAKWIGLRYAVNDSNKFNSGIASITCARKDDGKPVQIDNYCVDVMQKGVTPSSNGSVYWSQWMPRSLNVQGYVDASNEAHAQYQKDPSSMDVPTQEGTIKYTDPGELSGLYGWSKDGKTYIIAEVGLGRPEVNNINDSTTLYIDNVAVGNASSFTGAYEVMAGTSMATPCVTGCLAVIAKDEPASSTLSSEQLELEARERAAKLLASVDYDDDLAKLCRTGGRVNLREQSTFTKKAPLIAQAIWENGELKITGCFFGNAGELYVDDAETESTTWSDNSITAFVDGLDNGTHVAKVVNDDGAVSRVLFSYSTDYASGRPLYERDHSLPLSLKEYTDKNTDRLRGAMVACNGKLYAMSATMDHDIVQDMWSYDIASDTWALVELPEGYTRAVQQPGCMTAKDGKVYLLGEGQGDDSDAVLWQYDTTTAKWNSIHIDGLSIRGSICAFGNNLFLLDSYDYQAGGTSNTSGGSSAYALEAQADAGDGSASGTGEAEADSANNEQERSFFKLIDLEKGTLIPVKGDIPNLPPDGRVEAAYNTMLSRAVASDNKLYFYLHSNRQKLPGKFIRATYHPETQSMSVEDLTDTFKAAIGSDLSSYVDGMTAETLVDHFAIAGLSDGVAIIGSDEIGADTHIIKDTGTTAETYGRTSSYHHAANPLAVSDDGYLYVTANNSTEPSVMYFRSTDYNHAEQRPVPSPDSGTKASSAAGSPKTGDSLPAAALGVVLAFALAGLATALTVRRSRSARGNSK